MKKMGIGLAVLLPGWILSTAEFDGNPLAVRMAAVAALMTALWLTEAIPLAATALFPLVLFPVLGISSSKTVASQYMNSTVFLLIGGFMIALAMERWNLHKRIALNVISTFGNHPCRLMLGFMAATSFLSMWISNTATTLLMLPIAMAILARFEPELTPNQSNRINVGLLLAIAYSASIGGMMTLIGTAPNLVFAGMAEITDLGVDSIGFTRWMLIAVPVGTLMLLMTAALISTLYFRKIPSSDKLRYVILLEKKKLGAFAFEEKSVLVLFFATACLWITRKGIQIGDSGVPGWQDFFDVNRLLDDGTIAIAMSLVLFFIPAVDERGKRTTMLNHEVFHRLPWSVVVLFGGGFALASGFVDSGLSTYLATRIQGFDSLGLVPMLTAVSTVMTLLTELTSNTATTQLVLPILKSTAEADSLAPLWLMIPATLSASCAFMFPVATPPNAIIFGSGKIRVIDMVRTGFVLNLFGIATIVAVVWTVGPVVFNLPRF